jgi:hypothetical protein
MLGRRARLIATLLGLQAMTAVAPSSSVAADEAFQAAPAWWFCRAVGKRSVSGEAVLVYADSSRSPAGTFGRPRELSYVFNAPGVSAEGVKEHFLAEAGKQLPDVIAWRGSCEGFTSQELATQADKASRARDRAAFPPAEWAAIRGFVFRRG